MRLLRALRRMLVAIRDAMDGALHPRRRAAAIRRAGRLAPDSLLVICLGNICRSPYAAHTLQVRGGDRFNVRSAGFIGPGRAPPSEALEVAQERGIMHADHRSKAVDRDSVESADVILFFDRDNLRRLLATPGVRRDRLFWLGDFDPQWSGRRAIVDPWGQGIGAFRTTFERIDRCSAAFLAAVDGTAT